MIQTTADDTKQFVVSVQGNVNILKDWVNDLCERNYLDLDSIKLGVAALQGV